MKRRVLSTLTSIVMILVCGILPLNNYVITTNAAGLTLEQLKEKFPNGAYWNHVANSSHGTSGSCIGSCNNPDGYTWQPCAYHNATASAGQYDCNVFQYSIQCCGFAKKLAYDAYGSYCTNWAVSYDINSIKPGDVMHYFGAGADSKYGHWVFVIGVEGDSIMVGECNLYNAPCQIRWGNIISKSAVTVEKIYSAPSELITSEPLWYESLTPANFGDMVYATIESTVSGRSLVPEDDGNVVIRDASSISDPARYTWKFQRDSQGWYRIVNMYNSKSLDLFDAETTSGTNVQTFNSWDTHAQKWYVYCLDEAFCLRPIESKCVLDVAEGLGHEGNNVQIYENNGTTAQRFTINPVIVPAASTLSVNANVEGVPVAFNWTSANNAVSYQLEIVNSEADSSQTYTMPAEITSYELDLEAGKYKASVYTCRNGYRILSNTVSFTVYERPEISEDGWYYTEKLPADITNSDYEIQYKHTYQKTATTSPGADWAQGELASSKYENIGDSFTTAKQVATSDTCVMTDYYYYHYCGPSTGNVANYEQTSEFTHYDSIYPEYSVYVQSTGMDGEYPYFLLGWANDDNAVYCKSGTTCDGSYGTHEARSRAWYRMATYQNRQLVNYYYYTKQSDWETEADNTASVITYRYRIKNSEVTGDVNLDGSTNIADAVAFQQYLTNKKVTLDGTLDLNNDNAVNVFDLIILKRILINN